MSESTVGLLHALEDLLQVLDEYEVPDTVDDYASGRIENARNVAAKHRHALGHGEADVVVLPDR